MRTRPRDREPIAGQPKPRTVQPHWIDTFTRTTLAVIGVAAIIGNAIPGK